MIRVYQTWTVTTPINTLNRDSTQNENENMLGLPPQLTWHPFRLTAQHTTAKAEVKAADAILTSSKLHQWHPRMFDIWIERWMVLKVENLWKTYENPMKTTKKHPKVVQLASSSVTVFPANEVMERLRIHWWHPIHWLDASYGCYAFWIRGLMLHFWDKMVQIMSNYQDILWNWIWIIWIRWYIE